MQSNHTLNERGWCCFEFENGIKSRLPSEPRKPHSYAMESTTTTLGCLEKLVTVALRAIDEHERKLKFLQDFILPSAYFGSPAKESGVTPKRLRRKKPFNQKTEVSFLFF